jgi:hypothetical protein
MPNASGPAVRTADAAFSLEIPVQTQAIAALALARAEYALAKHLELLAAGMANAAVIGAQEEFAERASEPGNFAQAGMTAAHAYALRAMLALPRLLPERGASLSAPVSFCFYEVLLSLEQVD